MRKIAYQVEIREQGMMYNEGYLLLFLDSKGKFVKAEGIATGDYFCIQKYKETEVKFSYYENLFNGKFFETYRACTFQDELEIPVFIECDFINENNQLSTFELKTISKIDREDELEKEIEATKNEIVSIEEIDE